MNDFDYINLKPKEWDFPSYRGQLEKDDHMYRCLIYEYARHVQSIKNAFLAATNDVSQFDKYGNWHFWFVAPEPRKRKAGTKIIPTDEPDELVITPNKDNPNGMPTFSPVRYRSSGRMILTKLIAPPGFPDKPYLSCDHKFENSDRERSFGRISPVQQVKRLPNGVYINDVNSFELIIQGYQSVDGETGCLPVGITRGYIAHDDVTHLAIDPDTSIRKEDAMKAFEKILNTKRPKKETRNNQTEELLADLRRLGAYRVLKGRKFNDAYNFTESDRVKRGRCKEPLFSDRSEWSKAKIAAEAILTAWEQCKTYVMDSHMRNPIPLTEFFGI
jgi:hypothetical protein